MLLLLFFLNRAHSIFCSGYGCAPNPYSSAYGECIVQMGSMYSLSICEDDFYSYCPPEDTDQMCTLPETHNDLNVSYVGEPCVFDRNCLNSICVNSICTIDEFIVGCVDNSMCGPGHFCNNSECSPLIKANGTVQGCNDDFDCDYNSGCKIGQCIKYFSIPAGKSVVDCINGINLLCQYGACQTDRIAGNNYCTKNTTTQGSLPKPCDGDADCVFDTFTSGCRCGLNPMSQAYCNLAPGDPDFKSLISLSQLWLNSKNVTKCNTERRLSSKCIHTYADSRFYSSYEYYHQKVLNYPKIQSNDDCIKKIFTSDYWAAYTKYMSYKVKSHHDSFSLLLTGLGLWLV